MRGVVWSDMHFHEWTYGARILENGRNSRLQAQVDVVSQLSNFCMDRLVDYIFFCGDLFHQHGTIKAAVAKAVWEAMTRLDRIGQKVFVVGNHDMETRNGSVHGMDWLRHFGTVVDRHTVTNEGWCALPYTEDKDQLQNFLNSTKDGDVVLLHQGVSGVPMGSGYVINEILTPDMIPDWVFHCFTGHYHSHKRVSDKLTVVGSPLQHTWSDKGEKRGWVYFDTDTGEIEHIESAAPKFVEIQDAMTSDWTNGNYVRLVNWLGEDPENALSVERVETQEVETVKIREDAFSATAALESYIRENDLDDRRLRVGEGVRSGTYEVP